MLRFLLFAPIVILDTMVAALLVMFFGIFKTYSAINNEVYRLWAKIIVLAAGIKIRIEGKENIQADASYIMVANHQSHMDIPVLTTALPLTLRIISKKELFRIPFLGWGMKAAGFLKIDRTNRRKAIETLKKAEQVVRQHHLSILAFPEGTRSNDGRIQDFKKGPIVLAINTGLPLLPVSVSGTRRTLPKGKLIARSGRVLVKIHSPVPTADLSLEDRNSLVRQIQETIINGFEENYE